MAAEPTFLFVTCQIGAENALKQELARDWPGLRFSYSRPGFLTFKLTPGVPFPTDFDLHSVFARAAALSLGRAEGTTDEERMASARDLLSDRRVELIHVWPRDAQEAGSRGYEPGVTAASEATAARLREMMELASLADVGVANEAQSLVASPPLPPLAKGGRSRVTVRHLTNEFGTRIIAAMARSSRTSSHSIRPGQFATTRWSIVVSAGRRNSPDAQEALAVLCERYWCPLYSFVRRRGFNQDEAQDLTQEFFVHLLERDALQLADRERGRFRSFLLASLQNFIHSFWRREKAKKRGGDRVRLSLDFESAETMYRHEPEDLLSPERIFERRWAMTVLANAVARLREEHATAGKLALFETLKAFLGGAGETSGYRDAGRQLAMNEGAVKVAVYRLRRRCRELLRTEIAQTVTTTDEIDEELRELFAILSAG